MAKWMDTWSGNHVKYASEWDSGMCVFLFRINLELNWSLNIKDLSLFFLSLSVMKLPVRVLSRLYDRLIARWEGKMNRFRAREHREIHHKKCHDRCDPTYSHLRFVWHSLMNCERKLSLLDKMLLINTLGKHAKRQQHGFEGVAW